MLGAERRRGTSDTRATQPSLPFQGKPRDGTRCLIVQGQVRFELESRRHRRQLQILPGARNLGTLAIRAGLRARELGDQDSLADLTVPSTEDPMLLSEDGRKRIGRATVFAGVYACFQANFHRQPADYATAYYSLATHGTYLHKFTDPAASSPPLHSLVVLAMRFHSDTHPGRQRSTFSTAALAHPSRRTVFVYASNAGYARGTLRGLLNGDIRTFSGDDYAQMRWTAQAFRDYVFLLYHAKLPGWPAHIPFCNLSGPGAPSPSQMFELISLIHRGILRFEQATPEEIAAARLDVANAVPGPLFRAPLPDVARRDIGSRRPRFDTDGEVIPPRHERNGPKSAAWIGEEVEDSEIVGRAGWGPITMYKDGFRCVLEGGSWSLSEGGDGEEEDPIMDWD